LATKVKNRAKRFLALFDSIVLVAVIYIAMNLAILSVVPWREAHILTTIVASIHLAAIRVQ